MRMTRFIGRLMLVMPLLLTLSAAHGGAWAQDSETTLITENVRTVTQVDAFGAEQQVVTGRLVNKSDEAYTNIMIWVEAYDSGGEIIGEGMGVPVTACGSGLLPDFALQPQQSVRFAAPIDLYEPDLEIDNVALFPESEAIAPTASNPFLTFDNLELIATGDVVSVEWIDGDSLRFGVGCDVEVFNAHDWYSYDLGGDEPTAIEHPASEQVTDELKRRMELEDPTLFARSMLAMHPYLDERFVYQDAINTLFSIEREGTYKRTLGFNLSRFSLQGYQWLPLGRMVAYYYGAYGDPVRYLTLSALGQRISRDIDQNPLSFTVPGSTPDGARVIITKTVDGVTGYYFQSTTTDLSRLLFEAEPPGNNYPAPIYVETEAGGAFIYIIRPVNDQARLQCFDTTTFELRDLTLLPLELATIDRGWSMLSPDNRTLAIYANGLKGGLWLYDLSEAPFCQPPTFNVLPTATPPGN